MFILPLANKLEVLMKLKLPANIKEVRHFLGLTGFFFWKFICGYADILHPLNCLMCKAQPFIWIPECQASFDILHSWLTNTLVVQLPNPIKPYLLFMDVSKFHSSGVFTRTSIEDLNEALLKILTSEDPLKSVGSQTQDLHLESNVIHPVAYISGSFSQNQCRWPMIMRECFSVLMSIKECSFYLQMPSYRYVQTTNHF